MKKLKLAHIITNPEFGGVERDIYLKHNYIDRAKFNCTVISLYPEKGSFFESLRKIGIATYCFDFSFRDSFGCMIRIMRYLRQQKPDVIQIFGLRAELIFRPAAKLFGVTVISSITDLELHRPAWLRFLDWLTSKFVDVFVSNSYAARELFSERERYDRAKVMVVHNGLDLSLYETSEVVVDFEASKTNIITLGNLYTPKGGLDKKGHRYIVESIEHLGTLRDKVHFYFAGRDHQRSVLQGWLKEHGFEAYVTFLGFSNNVLAYLRKADIMLLPSVYEGLPNAIIEAMWCKVPVIATPVGGIPELIEHHREGLLIEAKSPRAIAEAITWALSHKDNMRQYAEAAHRKALDHFNAARMTREFEAIYESVRGEL